MPGSRWPFLRCAPFLPGIGGRGRFVQRPLGMDVADQLHVGRQLLQHAGPAVGAVAADEQLSLGKPACHQGNQLHGQFRPGAVVGVPLRLLRLLPSSAFFFPLVRPWRLRYSRKAMRQAPDLGGSPEGTADDQRQHDPIVPPTGQGLGPAGDQGIVVHARAVDGQAPFAAERVVHGQLDDPGGRKHRAPAAWPRPTHSVSSPQTDLAEEAMIAAVMSPAGAAAGPDQFGDETTPMGQDPSRHQAQENLKARLR